MFSLALTRATIGLSGMSLQSRSCRLARWFWGGELLSREYIHQ